MAEVYWIRLPEHTDMFTQGYIGVTTKTAKDRYRWHVRDAIRKDRGNKSIIQNAILKYGDNLIIDTLVICSHEYASDLEYQLRPSPKIGWNLRMGGESFEAYSAVFSGRVNSEATKKKMSESRKSLWSNDRQNALSASCSARMKLPRPVGSDGLPSRFWLGSRVGPMSHYWSKSQVCRDIYDSLENCSTKELTDYLGLEQRDREWFQPMLRYFDGGWVPKEDYLWISDYAQELSGSVYKNLVIPVDWSYYEKTWGMAQDCLLHFLDGESQASVERKLGLKRGSLQRMYGYFTKGWIPNEDPIWVSYNT